ncbi:MAG: sensor domain-containing diguanylate cyclase [Eubacteriales bacterium]|nr:sensor domain-containing diguanylate cyclase [Eubacteriales bacterium]
MNADKNNPWNNQTTQQLVRYEALFKLLDEIRSLEDIREIASHTSRQCKYFVNVACCHIILFLEGSNTTIDSARGEVEVNEAAAICAWDEHYHSLCLPFLVKKDSFSEALPPPAILRNPLIVEIKVLPIMRQGRCIGILSAGVRNEPFSEMDLKFLGIFGNHLIDRFFNIVMQKNYLAILLEKASYDPLTGLMNRGAILDKLDKYIALSGTTGEPVSVIIFDIDHFKKVNDTFGHAAGDLVLREIAGRLRLFTCMVDHFGRYGGEEFILVMYPGSEEQALVTAESLRTMIASHPFSTGTTGDNYIEVTISLGTATLHETKSGEELSKNADEALYRSKKNGRNQSTQF